LRCRGLDGLERQVGGKGPANEVGDGGGQRVEEVQEYDENGAAQNDVSFWDLSPLLEVVEDRVLGELL